MVLFEDGTALQEIRARDPRALAASAERAGDDVQTRGEGRLVHQRDEVDAGAREEDLRWVRRLAHALCVGLVRGQESLALHPARYAYHDDLAGLDVAGLVRQLRGRCIF